MVSVSGIGRIAKAAGKLIFMDSNFSNRAESVIKEAVGATSWRNIPKQSWRKAPSAVIEGFKEAEAHTRTDKFWSKLWEDQITKFPDEISKVFKQKGALNILKGLGASLIKKLPLIFVALEIPNIYSAYKDKGIVGGTLELAKSATRFATSMAGFIAGQALIPIPFVGGLIGAFATDWVMSKIIGKSHTEKKQEAEAKQQESLAQQQELYNQMMGQMAGQNSTQTNTNGTVSSQMNIPQMTMTPEQLIAIRNALYGSYATSPMAQDFMEMNSGIGRMGTGFNMMA